MEIYRVCGVCQMYSDESGWKPGVGQREFQWIESIMKEDLVVWETVWMWEKGKRNRTSRTLGQNT